MPGEDPRCAGKYPRAECAAASSGARLSPRSAATRAQVKPAAGSPGNNPTVAVEVLQAGCSESREQYVYDGRHGFLDAEGCIGTA
jgi:hypothetical protein